MAEQPTLASQLLSGNRRALARAITLVETGGPAARELMGAIYPSTGRAHILGVTGSPGAGKSTLVNALAQHWRRAGKTVGIVAVDPTSPFTGGAILGDRIRMQPLGGDAGVFVRSMASRGRLGGIARATDDSLALLDAAGFDMVIVETVGAGQSEIEVHGVAHTTIVVETPGAGDDVQSIKAGILEIADLYVVNKADREGAEVVMRQLRAMLNLGERKPGAWQPPVLPAVAQQGQGIAEIAAAVERHRAHLSQDGHMAALNQRRADRALAHSVQELALARATADRARWDALLAQIADRSADPYTAALALLDER
ncbi:methylmalonyl Co-A mutase-associated GTPase MeaB [Chloroflexia bacterium SDU3-3]|nr:methylmalonyl Co-A mutase-associated GTPase MeaB [Chloroflexia bacterium SDU3-3]